MALMLLQTGAFPPMSIETPPSAGTFSLGMLLAVLFVPKAHAAPPNFRPSAIPPLP